MSYGIPGDSAKARTIFENGVTGDPGYPYKDNEEFWRFHQQVQLTQ
jgi:hypothetical protein